MSVHKLHQKSVSALTLLRDLAGTGEPPPFEEMLAKFVRAGAKHPNANVEIYEFYMIHSGEIGNKEASNPKPKKLGGLNPHSAAAKRAARLRREAAEIEREADAVALVEQRYVARIAKDTTMHELYIITHAKLGKQNDHKGLARKHYTDDQLAKFKITMG